MKKLFGALIALYSAFAFSATTVPVQLLNPIGSTSGQTIVSTGASTAPAWGNVPVANVTGAASLSGNNTWTGTQTFSAAITPSQTAGIVGTTTNNNAATGSFGEYLEATSSSTAITSNTPTNVISLSLTAGDWDVSGNVLISTGTGVSLVNVLTALNTTSATLPAVPLYTWVNGISVGASSGVSGMPPSRRFSLSATTTVFLVVQTQFTGGSSTTIGFIRARRAR